jgi:hypothetical protein
MGDLPTQPEIVWLADTVAARMLVDAASDVRADQRLRMVRDWLPAEQLTDAQARAVSDAIAKVWRRTAGAVLTRLDARVNAGAATPLRGVRTGE